MIVLGMAGPLRPELLAAMAGQHLSRPAFTTRPMSIEQCRAESARRKRDRQREFADMRARYDMAFARIRRGNHYANRRRAADPLARLRNELEVDAALARLRDGDPVLARLRSAR